MHLLLLSDQRYKEMQVRSLKPTLPWQLKVAAKLVLARVPRTYRLWNRVGAFRPNGIGSHHTAFGDIFGGKLNDLRFNARIWEFSLVANSGFYTNRIRFTELLQLFRETGFVPQVTRSA
jgi:hypothetical protein